MDHPMYMVTHQMHSGLLKTLQDCSIMCEHTLTIMQGAPDYQARTTQRLLLHDCTDICGLCAKFFTRHSMYSKSLCQLCAYVCEACGNECMKFPDRESQMCGQMCLACAQECRAFAMA
ncbi:four-helix bundle copper-binding protein [Fodinisporobacter ferrooxydans]|uniref:Four-helix bundle copper-binding protein n=1 Tax=Fodinisporobacter ferrooxydans TaxID=2901836 RepID=A0ABY4CPB4_9BACL|nr:four-helix bundle copper-binding protein [Alicyclobacillaceae bacterium MYW30-H2]